MSTFVNRSTRDTVLRTVLRALHAPKERVTGMLLIVSKAQNISPPLFTEALRV
jgi:hypothetical protein